MDAKNDNVAYGKLEICVKKMLLILINYQINYFFESKHAFYASKKYLIELGNELFDTKKWNQLNTFLWI